MRKLNFPLHFIGAPLSTENKFVKPKKLIVFLKHFFMTKKKK